MLNRTTDRPKGRAVKAILLALALVAGSVLLVTTDALAAYQFKTPTKLTTTIVGSTQIEMEWLHVSGAPAYVIVASSSSDSTKTFRSGNNTIAMTGLKRGTTYSVKVAVASSTLSSASRISAYSTSLKVKTANNALNAPSDLAVTTATSSTAKLTWTAPANVAATDIYSVTYALDSGLKKSPKTQKTTNNTPSITLTDMAADTNFYVRVKVIDKDSGSTRSDTSDFGLIKTRAETGKITGTIAGPSASDVVVTAYDKSSDVVGQSDLKSNGTFTLTVRPGTYRVLATYVGQDGYTSLWAQAGSSGAALMSDGTQYAVTLGGTTALPTITLAKGATAAGVVKGVGEGLLGNVDVTAMLSGEVAARAVSSTDSKTEGEYSLEGLAPGTYTIRFKYRGINTSGVGFKTATESVTISGSGTKTVDTPTLALDSWAKIIRSKIKGTKSVGHTLKRYNLAWVASFYPKERATTWRYQWLRNGSAISGANAYKYKLTSADRGKKISLRITYYHIGFPTGSTTSKAYTVR
ncbi:MAG: fibronectin type III domain-containing protein [Propionibacteriaceae bacterium]|nr:fibronectin type III domain-containing protein [Propionibacteriaceae bacterium]